jgi:hypothetical protein
MHPRTLELTLLAAFALAAAAHAVVAATTLASPTGSETQPSVDLSIDAPEPTAFTLAPR